jgi:hypothetical protein
VQFGVDAHTLDCPVKPDGTRTCVLDSAIFVYDPDGTLLNLVIGGIHADIPAGRYGAALQSGLRFRQDISVPVKGETFLRIGVHDATTNHVGAVELPVAVVSKLPPISSAGATAPAGAAGQTSPAAQK